ncbi:FKBP-type peptidyl-prolyl cis-trans isomerase [Alloscardovia macacae]|nr:FKBP-type peptidyl-prolyl cis-trans isomerase [Alloscardovia macacae]
MHIPRTLARTAGALLMSTALVLTTAACGSSSSSSSSSSNDITFTQMTGLKAEGALGQKPTITFTTPFKVTNNSYEMLQTGDGAELKDGQKLCIQQIVLDPKTGKEVSSTWETAADCTTTLSEKNLQPAFYKLFKSMKVNSTVAIGVTSEGSKSSTSSSQSSSSSSSNSSNSENEVTAYIMGLTIVSAKTIPTRADGKAVDGIDSSLPKITLAKDGEPNIDATDLKDYKSDGQLKVQTLLQGTGADVTQNSTVTVQYKGWVLGGDASKPFDSSWSRGSSATFSLQQVVKGWTQGLTGQKVGSQVLLIIPPDLGYGSTAQNNIPANSTLVFVVDILDAQ